MDLMLIVILSVNSLCAAVYAIHAVHHYKNPAVALLFFLLPVLGFVFWYLPLFLSRRLSAFDYGRSELIRRPDVQLTEKQPSVEDELNIVPIEDAMAVSDVDKKRRLLLGQLKKDYLNNYKQLLSAENDTDSESSHYVAAAKMQIYSLYQKDWITSLHAYEDAPTDDNWKALMTMLAKFIDSELLSEQETRIYKKKYLSFVEKQIAEQPDWWDEEIATRFLEFLIDTGSVEKACAYWAENKGSLRSEKAYLAMLGLYHAQRDKEGFARCIRDLKSDKGIRLSSEGLSQLRYWFKKDMG